MFTLNIEDTSLRLKKDRRVVREFPWMASSPRPWKSGYTRVLVPLTDAEKRVSNKKHHTQIVRNRNLIRGNGKPFSPART